MRDTGRLPGLSMRRIPSFSSYMPWGFTPQFSRRGIAGRMARHVIAMAAQNGIKTVRLDVLEGNLPAEKAYTKVGFRYVETARMFYEDTGWTNYKLYEYIVL